MPKKIAVLVLLFLIAACAREDVKQSRESIDAVVSIIPYKYFVEAIGGRKVSVDVLIPRGVSPHTYEPTAKELKNLYNADVYFKVGGNFHFEEELLDKIAGNKNLPEMVDCSTGIELIHNNPHIWLGPVEVKTIARNIEEKLIQLQPSDSSYFSENYNQFVIRLDSLDRQIRNEFEEFTNKTFLVYHEAWVYFANHYGINELAIEAEGKEPGLIQMQNLVKEAKELELKHVYLSPGENKESALAVAQEIGAVIDTLDTLPGNYLNCLRLAAEKIKRDFN